MPRPVLGRLRSRRISEAPLGSPLRLAAAVAVTLAASCSFVDSDRSPSTVVIGLLSDPATLDAARATDARARCVATVQRRRGPYVVREWVRGDHLTFAVNPAYAGAAPLYRTVIFRMIPDPATEVLAIEKRDVSALLGARPDDLAALAQRPDLRIIRAACGNVPLVVSNSIAGIVPSRDGTLHVELWHPQ
ncbi:MAG: hypothetical protein JO060_02440 [Candidatus Eremiobacteraeota bacterium]|nr:hypothetical protein [Candidatus Eremiobacteraeota bacterium]MBV9647625.1 hypothetical protein [Candidatus Eremiobacteraeota bacterium]